MRTGILSGSIRSPDPRLSQPNLNKSPTVSLPFNGPLFVLFKGIILATMLSRPQERRAGRFEPAWEAVHSDAQGFR